MKIERAAVVGAGVMGSAIAAHIANAGLPVLLLDIVPPGAKERNALAEGALRACSRPIRHPSCRRRRRGW